MGKITKLIDYLHRSETETSHRFGYTNISSILLCQPPAARASYMGRAPLALAAGLLSLRRQAQTIFYTAASFRIVYAFYGDIMQGFVILLVRDHKTFMPEQSERCRGY